MKWFNKNIFWIVGLAVVATIVFLFTVRFHPNIVDSKVFIKQDNITSDLIGAYDEKISQQKHNCEVMTNKQNDGCVLNPGDFMGRMSLNGTMTINVKEAGKYNIQWIRNGYRAPDGKYLTTCMTSE